MDLQNELKRVAPVDEGRLKASIEVKAEGDEIVVYMVDYALYVEMGTEPHIIRPKYKQALAFESTSGLSRKGRLEAGIPKKDANTTIVKEVHHPGTQPQPFIRNTFYHKLKPIVELNAERYIPEVANEIEVSTG